MTIATITTPQEVSEWLKIINNLIADINAAVAAATTGAQPPSANLLGGTASGTFSSVSAGLGLVISGGTLETDGLSSGTFVTSGGQTATVSGGLITAIA